MHDRVVLERHAENTKILGGQDISEEAEVTEQKEDPVAMVPKGKPEVKKLEKDVSKANTEARGKKNSERITRMAEVLTKAQRTM